VSDSLRVVLDTNVLISALAFQGETRKVWDLVEEGKFELYMSSFILDELSRNLSLKSKLAPEAINLLLDDVKLHATIVEPAKHITVISAKDADNRILECAVKAKAGAIVTGNMKHIRPIGSYEGIEILTPREFLNKYFPSIAD